MFFAFLNPPKKTTEKNWKLGKLEPPRALCFSHEPPEKKLEIKKNKTRGTSTAGLSASHTRARTLARTKPEIRGNHPQGRFSHSIYRELTTASKKHTLEKLGARICISRKTHTMTPTTSAFKSHHDWPLNARFPKNYCRGQPNRRRMGIVGKIKVGAAGEMPKECLGKIVRVPRFALLDYTVHLLFSTRGVCSMSSSHAWRASHQEASASGVPFTVESYVHNDTA